MRAWIILLGLLIVAPGCMPLGFPMVARLPADEQKQLDEAWNAMLTPVHRVDRETLLDCVTMMQLYQLGVDRFTARSEKQTAAGRVEMTIEFDRKKPESDQFTLRVVGPWGQTLRREKWSAKELFAQYELNPDGLTATTQAMAKQVDVRQELRMKRFQAATQPAIQ